MRKIGVRALLAITLVSAVTSVGAGAAGSADHSAGVPLADTTPPIFNGGLPSVNVPAPAGATAVAFTYPTPTASDDVGVPSVLCAPRSGSFFPLGPNLVICVATNDAGLTAATFFDVTVLASRDYLPIGPWRLVDTRPYGFTDSDLQGGQGQLAGGSTFEMFSAGPTDAVALALNVTVTEPVGPGFVTVFPCGQSRPTASNVNFRAGETVSNAVIVGRGHGGGRVCFFVSQPLQLVVDLVGAFTAQTTFRSVSPARLVDTRADAPTIDGSQQGTGRVAAGSVTSVQVAGRAGVPADATTAALNITITEPAEDGFVTVYPCGTSQPLASNLNYTPGITIANLAITEIGTAGAVCIFNQADIHLVVDVDGYFGPDTTYRPTLPARLLDTRPGSTTIDGQSAGQGLRPAAATTRLRVAGRGAVASNVETAVLNLTVTDGFAAGFITVGACDAGQSGSSLNFAPDQVIANTVVTKVGADGFVCISNSQAANIIADVEGYFPHL